MQDGMIQREPAAVSQPRILFKPTSWLAKVDFINHLILFNNLLIAVLSEKKGGKTCFATLLQNNLDQQIKSVSLTITPPCNRENLIADLNAQLHLNDEAATNVSGIVAQVNERKAHVLLVIDNAQYLPESFIEEMMLAIKNQENFGYFHVCLVSDYSVVATLNHLAVNQFNNLIHTIEIGPLNESETRTYVLQRAMNASLINRPLTDAQFKEFYQLTKGNLAKINSTLESFIYNCSSPKKVKRFINLKKTSLAISAAVVVTCSYLFLDNFYQDPVAHKTITNIVNQRIGNLLEKSKATLSQNKPLESEIPSWLDASKHQFVQVAMPKKQYLTEDEYFPEEQEEEEQLNTKAILDKVVVIPKITPKKDPLELAQAVAEPAMIAANKATQKLLSKPVVAQKKAPKVIAQSVKAAKPIALAKKQTASVAVKKDAKVKAKPIIAGGYTIQLAASHKASDVQRFKSSHKALAAAQVRHFTNETGTWYVLTLGEFANRKQATDKVKSLSPQLAKLNPWVRSVRGLNSLG